MSKCNMYVVPYSQNAGWQFQASNSEGELYVHDSQNNNESPCIQEALNMSNPKDSITNPWLMTLISFTAILTLGGFGYLFYQCINNKTIGSQEYHNNNVENERENREENDRLLPKNNSNNLGKAFNFFKDTKDTIKEKVSKINCLVM